MIRMFEGCVSYGYLHQGNFKGDFGSGFTNSGTTLSGSFIEEPLRKVAVQCKNNPIPGTTLISTKNQIPKNFCFKSHHLAS